MAGVQPAADQIVGRSVDGFTAGFPTAWAMDPQRRPMIALGMNGEPLPVDHGYPARLIIPGLYGYVSATKWLSEYRAHDPGRLRRLLGPAGLGEGGPHPHAVAHRRAAGGRQRSTTGTTVAIAGVAWAPDRGVSSGRGLHRRRGLAAGGALGAPQRRHLGAVEAAPGRTPSPVTIGSASGPPTATASSRPRSGRLPLPMAPAATTPSRSRWPEPRDAASVGTGAATSARRCPSTRVHVSPATQIDAVGVLADVRPAGAAQRRALARDVGRPELARCRPATGPVRR